MLSKQICFLFFKEILSFYSRLYHLSKSYTQVTCNVFPIKIAPIASTYSAFKIMTGENCIIDSCFDFRAQCLVHKIHWMEKKRFEISSCCKWNLFDWSMHPYSDHAYVPMDQCRCISIEVYILYLFYIYRNNLHSYVIESDGRHKCYEKLTQLQLSRNCDNVM
jgi:hypothetical protein